MKDIFSTINFITILGLSAILLLGCVREQPKPVVKETQPSDPNYYIGPGGLAIDLREQEKMLNREGKQRECMEVAKLLPADDRLKYLRGCGYFD